MTTLSTTRTAPESLLRLAMRADAVLSGLCGIGLIAAAGPLSGFTGYPKVVEYGIGAGFVAYATVVFLAAGLQRVRPAGRPHHCWSGADAGQRRVHPGVRRSAVSRGATDQALAVLGATSDGEDLRS